MTKIEVVNPNKSVATASAEDESISTHMPELSYFHKKQEATVLLGCLLHYVMNSEKHNLLWFVYILIDHDNHGYE